MRNYGLTPFAIPFSANHPELKPGERWIQNTDNYDLDRDVYSAFYDLRLGEKAYTENGVHIPSLKPVFGKLKQPSESAHENPPAS